MTSHPDQSELTKALMGEDELGAVIHAHILVESQLLRLFELLFPHPQHLEGLRLGYRQRVDLALVLGLKDEFGPPLKKFGGIRNKFAHRPDAHLTQKDVTDLYGAFQEKDRKGILSAFASTKRKIAGSTARAFKALDPKNRFVFITISLHAIVLAAVLHVEREQHAR